VKSRAIRRAIERDPTTVFKIDLPEWRYGQQTGRREAVPAYITKVEDGYATLVAASERSVPERFPVQMVLGYSSAA
jgi:hypothetical protein